MINLRFLKYTDRLLKRGQTRTPLILFEKSALIILDIQPVKIRDADWMICVLYADISLTNCDTS